jgi:phospholipid/cholesterol/gamma-HCH transport system substrate-binding protein
MNLRISRTGAAGLALFAAVSVALFIYLYGRTGGPLPAVGGSSYSLHASFRDAEGITPRADVLVHGLRVGQVGAVSTRGGRTSLTLALNSARLPLHGDVSARIGQKTPLGESYVDLDPGRAGPRPPSGGRLPARPPVVLYQGVAVLDPPPRG